MQLPDIPSDKPVLIAGPTASGKSDLALKIARRDGGQIINADASQIYDCWRVITARPSKEDEQLAPHALYGHVKWSMPFSAGHWIRDVAPLLNGPARPIIVGGTGLYFSALTQGMAGIPAIPAAVRTAADSLTLEALVAGLDAGTLAQLDTRNRARVQRAYEVVTATGRSLVDWHSDTPPPLLPVENTCALVLDAPRDWLLNRIEHRFDRMLELGAIDEVRKMQDYFDPTLSSFKAIGVPELMAHLRGELTLDQARERVSIATRQFAKRQRTWFRSSKMASWTKVEPAN